MKIFLWKFSVFKQEEHLRIWLELLSRTKNMQFLYELFCVEVVFSKPDFSFWLCSSLNESLAEGTVKLFFIGDINNLYLFYCIFSWLNGIKKLFCNHLAKWLIFSVWFPSLRCEHCFCGERNILKFKRTEGLPDQKPLSGNNFCLCVKKSA